ncbi:TPR-like protein [Basidiobolus meristosporus CBS 931.73]|uniref:Tetratricopeptide repeat and J domain-containing co-chaperone DNJ1 n=1 Tax=Basidiobolus meristosporus CBS 931.73 TaxID=1314790 RepID=A0A1Y1Y278_9FUNG|nr:TPR-like protein [Basidiobolus meristosporus CBS 931.73]|eukprot:ORX92117.1 TPR-like protein [Basidiobolus meristosporus CBS 931.73]
MKLYLYLSPVLSLILPYAIGAEHEKTTQQYLDEANRMLAAGRFNEALSSYDSAIERDPSNYLTYFKRATTYLSLGRSNAALEDFNKILDIKPDFEQALFQRAKINLKEGFLSKAKSDIKEYMQKNPTSSEGKKYLDDVQEAETSIDLGENALKSKNYDDCIKHYTKAITIASTMSSLRLKRADCYLRKGEIEAAVGDFSRAATLNPADASNLYKLSNLQYFILYDPQHALNSVKQCLTYDPDDKLCKPMFRKIKKLEKDIKKAETDVEKKLYLAAVNKLIGPNSDDGLIHKAEEEVRQALESIGISSSPKSLLYIKLAQLSCKAYVGRKNGAASKRWCTEVLNSDENNVEALVGRGEAHMLNDEFEEAVRDFTKANELNGHDQEIQEKLMRAQRLLKQSQTKDYYKVLGVNRSATKREIKKAYRKLAGQWHPDKYKGDLSPDAVAKKMSEINEAYEVLSDDELRARFDHGDDPNDPTGGQQHHGNPFGQGNPMQFFFQNGGSGGFGGFPFGAGGDQGGFQFKYHY